MVLLAEALGVLRWHGPERHGVIMNPQEFAANFVKAVSILSGLSKAVGDDASLLGCLNIEEYQLFQNLIKEMAWYGRA